MFVHSFLSFVLVIPVLASHLFHNKKYEQLFEGDNLFNDELKSAVKQLAAGDGKLGSKSKTGSNMTVLHELTSDLEENNKQDIRGVLLKFTSFSSEVKTWLWPEKTLLFRFAPDHFSKWQKQIILDSMSDLENNSCIKFREATDLTRSYVLFKSSGPGCASTVGYQRRPSDVILNELICLTRGSVQHELLHSLGMWHEHTRPDRDSYVKVLWNNIPQDKWYNFLKRMTAAEVLKFPYDYLSVMHYRSLAFSKNQRSPALLPRYPEKAVNMGQRIRVSNLDLAKLNALYACHPTPTQTMHTQIYSNNKTKLQNNKIDQTTKNNQPQLQTNINNQTQIEANINNQTQIETNINNQTQIETNINNQTQLKTNINNPTPLYIKIKNNKTQLGETKNNQTNINHQKHLKTTINNPTVLETIKNNKTQLETTIKTKYN